MLLDPDLDARLRPDPPPPLPPARERDVAAEALAAAAHVARRSGRHPDDAPPSVPPRPLAILALNGDPVCRATVLVAEEVSVITSGRHNGTTWLKPLAMRSAPPGAPPAEPLARFDDKRFGVHVFSSLAPAVFVPTARLRPASSAEVTLARAMTDAHHADEDEASAPDADGARLRELMAALARETEGRGFL